MQMCPSCSKDNRDTARMCIYCGHALRGLLGQGTLLNERYEVVHVLGCGGMGAVYLAHDRKLAGGRVALKENFESDAGGRRQFLLEAQILFALDHPNLPQVMDFFTEPSGREYLVMEYIEGEDLDGMVQRRGPLQEKEALQIMEQVFWAVDYLHRQQPPIIHRDIKPGNIKVRRDGLAYLVDLGIAKVGGAGERTATGARAVTPGYSPLEQYSGSGATDHRSDIYSLGATLYFMLTGRVPPEAVDLAAKSKTLTLPSRLNPRISKTTEQCILKAMSVFPPDRFRSVREFEQGLTGMGGEIHAASGFRAHQNSQPSAPAPTHPHSAAPGAVASSVLKSDRSVHSPASTNGTQETTLPKSRLSFLEPMLSPAIGGLVGLLDGLIVGGVAALLFKHTAPLFGAVIGGAIGGMIGETIEDATQTESVFHAGRYGRLAGVVFGVVLGIAVSSLKR